MTSSFEEPEGLGFKTAALVAGCGLLLMTLSAPPAFFYFMPQGVVDGDPAATLAALQGTGGPPYLIGGFLLFLTYCMDIVVAWGLFWLIRPGQIATAQLVAWTRLVYAALAFTGLGLSFRAYELANSAELLAAIGETALQTELMAALTNASIATAFALFFFGIHLLVLAVGIVKSARIPNILAILITLAGLSYIIMHVQRYVAPNVTLDWLLFLALGELIFMLWLLVTGIRKSTS